MCAASQCISIGILETHVECPNENFQEVVTVVGGTDMHQLAGL